MALVLAVLLGLVAYTASPIAVALAAAAIVGPMLVAAPLALVWTLLGAGLLVAGVVPIWAEGQAGRIVWALSALSFLLMAVMLFRALTNRNFARGTPAFVWIALAFMGYAVLNGLLQWNSAYEFLSGFKRYFQAAGLMFALVWLGLDDITFAKLRRFVLIVAAVQLPWALYERVRLVHLREALAYYYPGLVPIDVVAGTFGANMTTGGANAEMATFQLFMLGFLLSRLRERLPGAGKRLLLLGPLIMAPLFLGETKVVIIFMPLLFILIYRRELMARPHLALMALAVGAILTVAAGTAYVMTSQRTLGQQWQDTLSYNFSKDKGYGGRILNRTTVLTFWAGQQTASNPVSPVFGNGIGAAHDASGGHLALRYANYGISLTAASLLLWEQGLFGFGLFSLIFLTVWFAAGRLRATASESWVRADAAAIQAAVAILFVYLFYRLTLLESLPFQLVFYGMLGYLGWLCRRERKSTSTA